LKHNLVALCNSAVR